MSRGFTLIEMVIYIGLLSLFIVILTDIFTTTINTSLESQSATSIETDARFILARFNYDILRADSITIPASRGSAGNNLSFTADGNTVTYTPSGGNLVYTDSLGSNNLNSSNSTVSSINFIKLGNSGGKDVVKMEITLVSKITRLGNTPDNKTYTLTVGRR